MASEEERVQELVEAITAASGTHEIIALAKELHDLLGAIRNRPKGNSLAKPADQ